MASVAASAGLLVTGATVALALPRTGTCTAQVADGHDRALTLDLLDEPPAQMLEEGSVVDMFVTVSAGVYEWLCLVSRAASGKRVAVQLLSGPVFVPARSDPRVVVNLPAQVRADVPERPGRSSAAVVTDLSRGGMKLVGAPDLQVGDLIEVSMELWPRSGPATGAVSIMGRVVTTCSSPAGLPPDGEHVHISFIGGQQKALEAVSKFVAQRLERAGIV